MSKKPEAMTFDDYDDDEVEPDCFAFECICCMVTQDHPGPCDICGNETDGMEF